jgi:hypothetical protein
MELNENEDENDDNETTEQPLPIVDLRCEVIKENDWDGIIAIHEKRRRVSGWNFIRATRSQHRFEHERFATKVYHNIEVLATCCDISPCGNFCVIGYSTGHIDMYNMQSGLYRGSFGKNYFMIFFLTFIYDHNVKSTVADGRVVTGLVRPVLTGFGRSVLSS